MNQAYAYLRRVFTELPKAQSLADIEALLPTPARPRRPDLKSNPQSLPRRASRTPFAGRLRCAVERHRPSAGANPARQLSLQPVAIGAGDGGNDMA